MKKNLLVIFLNSFSMIVLAQGENWVNPVKIIENEKRNINKLVFYDGNDFALDKDSLSVSYNTQESEEIKLTLYHDEISVEPGADYYIVGMDIPIMEFIELVEKEQQICLIFSRNCKTGHNNEKQRLELNIANQDTKEALYLAFEEILKIRDSQHQELHELNQCNIGSDY